jgi:hypothetical protein
MERHPLDGVRHHLARARAQGIPFDDAWPDAADAIDGDGKELAHWRVALKATRHAWQAADERTPADRFTCATMMVATP